MRSIQSSPVESQFATRASQQNSKFRGDSAKTIKRRNFNTAAPAPIQNPNVQERKPVGSTFRPSPYKRRTFTTSTTPSSESAVTIKIEGNANRFRKNYRKNVADIVGTTTIRAAATNRSTSTRRPFTPRTTSENVLATTSEMPTSTKESPLKKVPFTRGNFRPKTTDKEKGSDEKEEGDNYPEHFKQLLKNKEVNTQQNDKSVLKKPVKPFRPPSTERSPNLKSAGSSNIVFPTRQNRLLSKIKTTTEPSLSTDAASESSQQLTTLQTKRPLRTRPRPTERTKLNIGSTLQEPPTAKTTKSYATQAPPSQSSHVEFNTQTDGMKQIDPPIREYFPRTSAVSFNLINFVIVFLKIN